MSGKDNFNECEWPIETYCTGSIDQLKKRQFALKLFALSSVIKDKAKILQGTYLWEVSNVLNRRKPKIKILYLCPEWCSLKPIIEIRFILLSVVLNILLSALDILYGCVEYDLIMDFKMLNMYSVLSNFQYCTNGGKTEEIEAFLKYEHLCKKKKMKFIYKGNTWLIIESK